MKTSKRCSIAPEAMLQEEKESLDSEASQIIITLFVIVFMSLSTALSMALENYNSPNLPEVETQN